VLALKELLKRGTVSTDELQALGYNHPPRIIGDIRDAGIPVITGSGRSKSGHRMAVYSLGAPGDIQAGRIGGRSAFPKAFKAALVEKYGSADRITGAQLNPRVLQIDHRIPYRIAGDAGLNDLDLRDYMLLDASSQRAKSWSCEHCPNMLGTKNEAVCKTCFWAFPESYTHIATHEIRRTDIVWQGDDVPVHDKLNREAVQHKTTVGEILKRLARQKAKDS
ncbi:MAG: hypothetical protein ACRDRL_25365, partial [Sciscionella sp.]